MKPDFEPHLLVQITSIESPNKTRNKDMYELVVIYFGTINFFTLLLNSLLTSKQSNSITEIKNDNTKNQIQVCI
jgi:hypothetical protein